MISPVLVKIYTHKWYILLATAISLIVFSVSVLLPNIPLLFKIFHSDSLPLVEKSSFFFSFYGAIQTNFTALSATYTILIALLFGINIALFSYYIKQMKGGVRSVTQPGTVSLGGFISGIFGIGCAACGTFIASALLAIIGAGGILSLLPFGGEEFGFIGVFLLAYSTYSISKKIRGGRTCPI